MTNPGSIENDLTLPMAVMPLAKSPAPEGSEDRLAHIMDQYLVSLEHGAPLDLHQMIEAHPDLSDEIRSITASLDLLHDATRKMRPRAKQPNQVREISKRLGDFEIGREVGRGGMGVVYAARQISLQRQVALKVLPFAAMWDSKQIARFRNEALAAAQLHHPNIVPVFAVGQERGVHFYAMQFIDGQSFDQVLRQLQRESEQPDAATIQPQALASTQRVTNTPTVHSAARDLSTQHTGDPIAYCRAIAEFGRQAASALHHAHEYGVLHRDIKPSNLMVDGNAKLWITDFGLARIQSNPSVTMTGDMVGTLRYMSPEQAAGQHALVDTRTDIYGLGATLYELLTLRHAFPGDDRHAVLRDIEAKEPVSPRSLNPAIPVDLETIVLQAMAKSRDSRYATAQELADDLGRFLDGKPTLARRPTLLDRTSKWIKRHRSFVTMAALFLAIATVGSMVAAIKIAREQQRTAAALAAAEDNLKRAEEHFAQARGVVDRFGIQLADQLQETPGTERLRQQLLLETLNYYREFAAHIDGQLDVRDQLAMTHLKTGVVTAKLGANRKALAEYQAAQQLMQQLLDQEPGNDFIRSQLALSRNNVALLHAANGNREVALKEFDLAIDAQQQLITDAPDSIEYTSQLAESHLNVGTLLGQMGKPKQATGAFNAAIRLLTSVQQAAPRNVEHARSLAMTYNNLGHLQRAHDASLAEQSASTAVDLLERVCQTPAATTECLADLAVCYGNLAAIQSSADRAPLAIRSYDRAVDIRESLVRKAPAVVRYRSELAGCLNNLALLHIRAGDASAANEAFVHANHLFAGLIQDYPQQVAYAGGWAALLNNQGLALAAAGRLDEAISAYEQAVGAQERVWKQLANSPVVREALSRIYYNYGRALQQAGRTAEARQQARARRALWIGDGERMFSVAVELAQLAASDDAAEDEAAAQSKVADEVIETLAVALQNGYQPQIDLRTDERFELWHDHPRYRALSELDQDELVRANARNSVANP